MRKYGLLAAAFVVTLGCSKEETPAKPAEAAKVVDAAKPAADAGALKTDGGAAGAMTLERYEQLLLALSACPVVEFGIDRNCEGWKAYDEARKNRVELLRTTGNGLSDLGRKHITHANPAVRLASAELLGSIFGASEDSQKVVIEAAKNEQDPLVLRQLIRTVASSIKRNDEVRQLILGFASHTDPKVRVQVASALTSSWAADTEGTLEKALEMIEKDASEEVRTYACKYVGGRADERALPILTQLTEDATKEPKIYGACMKGLIGMWSSPVAHKVPSQKAYELTLKRLKVTPRSKELWMVISAMDWASKKEFQERATWFKAAEIQALLDEMVLDKSFYWLGRTAAASTLSKLGADKAHLEGLKAKLGTPEGDDTHVVKKLDELIAKAG